MYTLLSQSSLSAPRDTPGNHFSKWAKSNDEKSLERRQTPSDSLSLLKDDMTNNNIANAGSDVSRNNNVRAFHR